MKAFSKIFSALCGLAIGWTLFFSVAVSAAPQGGHGQLVVKRSANFGANLSVDVFVDGRSVGRLQIGHTYQGTLPAGQHEIMVQMSSRRSDTSPAVTRVVIQPGRTYQLTAGWSGQDLVLR